MTKGKPFTDYELPREIRREIHEHEILIAFTNDDDAILFYEWWNKKGAVLFNNYRVKTGGQTN